MERTKKTTGDGKIRYKKIGGGSLRIGNKIVKPGEVFMARPDSIPENFKDSIIPLDKLPPEEEIEVVDAIQYSIQHRAGSWYNVVAADGKVMNEKALSRENALKYIEELNA